MNQWPVHVEPLDRAILDLLSSLPPAWGDYDAESLTGSEQQAIRLMVRAGIVEMRLCVRATMDNRDELLELVLTVTGEYDAADIWRVVLDQVPEWLDAEGRTRGRCRMWSDPQQVRLTDQGDLARHDYENQTSDNPSAVCAFVRKLGFFSRRPPVPPRIRVESCSTNTRSGRETGPVVAAAKATVGDITIHNNIQIDHGAIVEQLLSKLDKRNDASLRSSEKQPSPEPPPDMKPSARLAGASFERVEREHPELCPPANSPMRYSKAQWNYIREHYDDIYPLDTNGTSTMPAFDTWSRYVREYLRHTDGPKNSPRYGRPHGHSIASAKDLDQSRRSDS